MRIEIDKELIEKELREAEYDLGSAEKSIKEKNYEWAMVQSYYSMFHSLRGLLFSRGFREKGHICLKFALEALFVDNGLMNKSMLEDFDFAIRMREGTDYGYTYSRQLAEGILKSARRIVGKVKELLNPNI